MIHLCYKQKNCLPALCITTLFTGSFALSASAAPLWQEGQWLAQIGGGLALSKGLENDRTLNNASYPTLYDQFKHWEKNENHSFFWLLGAGYEMPMQHYKIRVGLSYNQMGELESKGVRGPTGDLENYDLNYSYKTSSQLFMADVGFQIPVTDDQKAYFQLNLGLGISRNTFKGFSSTPAEGADASLAISDNEESQFAWSLGASMGIPLHEFASLEFGYRYVDAGKLKSGQNSTYSSPLVDDTLAFHLFEARLAWRF